MRPLTTATLLLAAAIAFAGCGYDDPIVLSHYEVQFVTSPVTAGTLHTSRESPTLGFAKFSVRRDSDNDYHVSFNDETTIQIWSWYFKEQSANWQGQPSNEGHPIQLEVEQNGNYAEVYFRVPSDDTAPETFETPEPTTITGIREVRFTVIND